MFMETYKRGPQSLHEHQVSNIPQSVSIPFVYSSDSLLIVTIIQDHPNQSTYAAMTGFRIRSAAIANEEPALQVFVSKYTNDNGSHSWYSVAPNFNDAGTSHWNRNAGFEVVVFKNQWGKTRAFYLQVLEGHTTEVTFFGMEQDISLNYVKG